MLVLIKEKNQKFTENVQREEEGKAPTELQFEDRTEIPITLLKNRLLLTQHKLNEAERAISTKDLTIKDLQSKLEEAKMEILSLKVGTHFALKSIY